MKEKKSDARRELDGRRKRKETAIYRTEAKTRRTEHGSEPGREQRIQRRIGERGGDWESDSVREVVKKY